MTDDIKYTQWQQEHERQWEALCGRCGACCGAFDGDPCEHLRGEGKGGYYCAIYATRFGEHKTRSGKTITCVPIRTILNSRWPGDECCGYKKTDGQIV